jgi:acetyl esterase/lipase
MKLKIIFYVFMLCFTNILSAQQQVFQIWSGAAPGSEDWKQKETQSLMDDGQFFIRNVVTPSLTVFIPDSANANGTALIVAPGGGFRFLSWKREGIEVSKWLASKGVTVFLLKYRLLDTGTEEDFLSSISAYIKPKQQAADKPMGNPSGAKASTDNSNSNKISNERAIITRIAQEDGKQAIRVVRQRAAEWKIDPSRIGILGFSAGGIVTIGALTEHDQLSRPDFAGVIYSPYYGQAAPADAPPIFILVAGNDNLASSGSIDLYNAWKATGQEAELHVYSKGGHGFGMHSQSLPSDNWIELFWNWIETLYNFN